MTDVNMKRSKCRVTVEWGSKEMTGKWAFMRMKPQQKFLLSPVAVQYSAVALFLNWPSCLNQAHQIPKYFGVLPSTLEEKVQV